MTNVIICGSMLLKGLQMINTSRSREKLEGWRGRRRTYICRVCRNKFQVDTLEPLKVRICPNCKGYQFVNSKGDIIKVDAPDAELATLRAWKIDPTLTFRR